MAGQIRVEVDGLGTLEFPDGTDPAVIDRTVKREIAGRQTRGLAAPSPVDRPPDPFGGDRVSSRSVSDLAAGTAGPSGGSSTVATALRVVPGVGGSFLGPVGGAIGAGLGELAAQGYEYATGLDDDFNVAQVGLQSALGAIPGVGLLQKVPGVKGLLGRLMANAATGAAVAGPAQVLTEQVEEQGAAGLNPAADPSRVGERMARGATVGALFGSGASLVGDAASAALRRRSSGPRPTVDNVAGQAGSADRGASMLPASGDGAVPPGASGAVPGSSVRRIVGGLQPVTPNPARRRELLNATQVFEAAVDPARMNAIRVRAETGDILKQPTTAGPRVIEGLTRRQTMAPEAAQSSEFGAVRALDALPGVRNGAVTPEQAGFLKWLADDLRENPFEQGGLSPGQLRDMYDRGAMEFRAAPHSAGTRTLQTFNALGVDASRSEIRNSIDNLLNGKPGGGAADAAALRYVEAMREGWTGDRFDWSRVTDDTLARIGLGSRKELHSPRLFPEAVFEGQGQETREYFAPALRDEADGPIPDGPRIVEGLRRRRPAEDVRTSQPLSDPLAHVEPFLQRMPEELRPGLRQVLADNAGFADQRRESMPFGYTDRLSRQLAVDVSRTLPKGSALNAESLRAYANAVATTGDKVKRLTDKVNASQATDADLVGLQAARSEHAAVLASMMGARAEAGRALSSFRMFSKVLETGDTNLIRAALKAPGARSNLNDLAQQLAAVGDDPLARYQFLAQQAKQSFGDKFRSYYYANILSGLKTHERNFLGNAFNSLTNLATVPAAGAIDAVKSRATGQPRTVFAGELPAQVIGGLVGTERGFRDFVFTLREGISPRNLSGTLDAAASGQFDLARVEMGGGGKNPFNWPGRMLEATDAFFRSIARNQEFYGLAYAQARREGLKGPQITERIAQLKTDDSPLAKNLESQADAYATRAVFQEEPGKVARWLQHGSQSFPPLAFVIPFIKTPANILRQGAEFSPAGALMKGARQPGRVGSQAQARVALGTMMLAPLAWLAATGRLSGSGPQDSAERAGKMEAGWRPNSVKLRLSPAIAQSLAAVGGLSPAADGEYWVSYSLFQPVSVPASVVANSFESWQAQGEKGSPSVSTVATAAMRTARSVLDQSYLSGLFDILEAIDNPDQWASRYLARTAHSLTPFAGAQRSAQQAADPTVRQPKGFAESFAANVPGLSDTVPARIDRFGEEITRPGNAAARAGDPFNVSPVQSNPVAFELQRLGVDVTLPNARIELQSGRQLSREEEQQVKQSRGRAVGQQLGMLLGNPMYQRMTDDSKRAAVLRVIERARGGATKQLKGQLRHQLRGSLGQ